MSGECRHVTVGHHVSDCSSVVQTCTAALQIGRLPCCSAGRDTSKLLYSLVDRDDRSTLVGDFLRYCQLLRTGRTARKVIICSQVWTDLSHFCAAGGSIAPPADSTCAQCRRDTFFDLEYFGVHARRAAAGPGHYYARSGARQHRATISFISWLEVAVLQAVRVLTAGS